MHIARNKFAAAMLTGSLFIASSWALAGAADMQSSDGGKMKFEYRGDDLLRINMQEGNYMLVKGDQIYVVTNSDGQLMVISLNQAMSLFGSMADAATPSTVEGKLISMKSTGRSETVAGIVGEIYEVRFIDHNGEEQNSELVLSSDRRAIELQRAMFNMARNMAKAANKDVKGSEEMERKLEDMNKGTLRFGKDMWVTAISDRSIDQSRFELPAEPTDLSALQGVFGGGQSGSSGQSGGIMSGILGAFGKQGQQQGETGDAEKEAEDEAEGGEDPIKKAFGKLFGK